MSRVWTVEDLNGVIAAYKQQQQDAAEQLRTADEQRVHLIKTLDLLQGAIIALETLRATPPPAPVETPQADEPPQTDGN